MAAIAGLLAGWAMSDLNKVIVFLVSRESVEYHYEILSWLAGQKNDGENDEENDSSAWCANTAGCTPFTGTTTRTRNNSEIVIV